MTELDEVRRQSERDARLAKAMEFIASQDVEARLDELESRLNATEAALTDVCKMLKAYKWRLPAALLAWYSRQTATTGEMLP